MSSYQIIFDKNYSLLHIHILLKDYDKLEKCLQNKELDVNNSDFIQPLRNQTQPITGWTPLHIAVYNNDIKSSVMLIGYGADVNARTGLNQRLSTLPMPRFAANPTNRFWLKSNCFTPLHLALKNQNRDMCRLLIQNKADVNALDTNNKVPLELCLQSKEMVKLLIESGADYKSEHFDRYPLIFQAIDAKNLCLIRYLIGIQTKGFFYQSKNPIEYAVKEFPDCVSDLIKSGKQIYFANSETGEYLIELFIRLNRSLWVEELCEMGIETDRGYKDGNRLMHLAAIHQSSSDLLLILYKYGARIDRKNTFGLFPISYAIENGNEELTSLLFCLGSPLSPNLRELERALRCRKFKTALILLQNCTQIDENLLMDSEPVIWFFIRHCVGDNATQIEAMTKILEILIEKTSGINTIDSVWGSLLHYLIYADICVPSDSYKPLFDIIIESEKCNLNLEFEPKDTLLRSGELIQVERIVANGTALSFALEMPSSQYYSEKLIKIGADITAIDWDQIFFAPEKVNSFKMLINCGLKFPNEFREYSDPNYDITVGEQNIQHYSEEFHNFLNWMDTNQTSPPTLKQMSRNIVRKAIGYKGLRRLIKKDYTLFGPELYPTRLYQYLLYN